MKYIVYLFFSFWYLMGFLKDSVSAMQRKYFTGERLGVD